MAEPERIVINASTLGGIDYSAYFNTFFAGLGASSYEFYGDKSFETTGIAMGTQAVFRYANDPTDEIVTVDGKFSYDMRTHGIFGSMDGFTLGKHSGVVTGPVTGLTPSLGISNLNILTTSGPTFSLYTALRNGDGDAIRALLATKAQHFIGGDGKDTYTGTAFDDFIDGGAGNDTLNGGDGNDTIIAGAGDDTIIGGDGDDTVVFDGDYIHGGGNYTFVPGANGLITITDSRTTGGTGVDKLTSIEYLRFNNLTYNINTHQINYAPTDVALDDSDVDGDASIDVVVGSLTATDSDDAANVLKFTLVDDADGMFKVDGSNIVVADGLAAGSHTIRVKVTDSVGNVLEKEFTINVSNLAPEITSHNGAGSVARNVAENETEVTTVTWADGNGRESVTYSLSGDDANLFKIDPETGVLSFKSAPDFENARDNGRDNFYNVVVRATDKGGLFAEQAFVVEVTDGNDAPTITSDGGGSSAWIEIAEGTKVVTTVKAGDVDAGANLTYSLDGGADEALFKIDPTTGKLSFKSVPDFEKALDAGKNNVYDVIVKVSDGSLFDTQALKIEITDLNDNKPVFTSSSKVKIAENTKLATTVKATDADAGTKLSYALAGGADQGLFTIDSKTGALSFKSVPDFEKALDAGKNNVYDVIVKVSDGSLFDTQALKIEITDLNDNKPVFTSSSKVKIAENTKIATTVKATDADAGTKLSYALAGGADQGLFTIDSKTGALSFKSAPDFEAAKDANKNNVYEVTVKVSDGTNSTLQSLQVSVSDVKGVTRNGGNGNDTLIGTGEQDVLNGGKGNDTLKGGAADDRLYGGAGADKLYGEAGADTFVFRAKGDSTLATAGRDTIYGFDGKAGDRIDLSGFDANDTKSGLQDFSYIGAAKFSGKAGELRFEKVGTKTYVYADTNGDKTADFAINFDNSVNFQKDYFVL